MVRGVAAITAPGWPPGVTPAGLPVESASTEGHWALSRFPATGRSARLAFADAEDPRVQHAVRVLAADGVVTPVVIGSPKGIAWPAGVDCIAADDPYWAGRVAEVWPGPVATDALALLAVVVRLGVADAGIAGSLSTSPAVLRAGLRGVGISPEAQLASGAFIVAVGDTLWTWADCSVVPEPDADQLAAIAAAASELHSRISGEPARVAMLSFSTDGSTDHPAARKVRDALAVLRERHPALDVDGEMQFDAAVDPVIGRRKFPGSDVAGHANVFIFPDLDAGNIAYKVVQRVGQARIMGSFVLGLTQPWVDLSRGCSAAEIVRTAYVLRTLVVSSSSPAG
jgi:phosphotransacetylase